MLCVLLAGGLGFGIWRVLDSSGSGVAGFSELAGGEYVQSGPITLELPDEMIVYEDVSAQTELTQATAADGGGETAETPQETAAPSIGVTTETPQRTEMAAPPPDEPTGYITGYENIIAQFNVPGITQQEAYVLFGEPQFEGTVEYVDETYLELIYDGFICVFFKRTAKLFHAARSK